MNAPITNTAVSGMPRARAGSAAAIASTSRQVGVSLGVAIAGTCVRSASGAALGPATHAMWWVVCACGALIALLGVLASTPWDTRSTQGVAHLLDSRTSGAGGRP